MRTKWAIGVLVTALVLVAGCASGAEGSRAVTSTADQAASGAPGGGGSALEVGSTPAPAAGPSAGCGRPPAVPAGRTTEASVSSGGRQRTYLVHLPAGYQPNRPLPVVLAFHGRKGTGNDIEGFSGIDALPVIAVYPRGLPASDGETAWQGAPGLSGVDDVRFTNDLLDRLQVTLCVDQHRIFATGKSEGGGFTALLACTAANRVAAFATVSGAFYPGTDRGCATSPPVALLDFHGTGDQIIKYQGGVSHQQHYPPMADWLASRAARNHCAANPDTRPIGPDVTVLSWPGCAPGAALVHYRIAGGGHTWAGAVAPSGPGVTTRTVSATQVMWTFFQAHPRP